MVSPSTPATDLPPSGPPGASSARSPSAATASATTAPAPSTTAAPKRRRRRPPRLSAAAWRQFLQIAKPYWLGDQRKAAWGLLLLLIVLMLCETQLAVLLNAKTGELTSAG